MYIIYAHTIHKIFDTSCTYRLGQSKRKISLQFCKPHKILSYRLKKIGKLSHMIYKLIMIMISVVIHIYVYKSSQTEKKYH